MSSGSPIIPRDLSLTSNQEKQLLSLLETYASFFSEPQGLPPPCSYDHAINLLPNHDPVTVRLYHYPYIQKAEIELQVQEMLQKGMIRHSKSGYSSPVILVRKKKKKR